jgi:hypothetical protein
MNGTGDDKPKWSCATCRFFDAPPEKEAGRCRRYAPRPGVETFGHWAIVTGKDWCGDWLPAAPTPAPGTTGLVT